MDTHPAQPPWPCWIAHRGAGHLAPENTLAAFRHGMSLGLRAFECDVKLSADGVPFLLHDDTLERTTSGCGLAHTQSWAELSQLDAGRWHGPDFAGEPPASLAAILHLAATHALWLNLELKPGPGDAWRTGKHVARVVTRFITCGLARWPDLADSPAAKLQHPASTRLAPPLLSSFQPEALAAARATAPGLPRALLTESLDAQVLAEALALGCTAVVAHHPALNAEAIRTCHQRGLHVLAYTVNQPQEAQRLMAAGVDALITDAINTLPGRGLEAQTLPP